MRLLEPATRASSSRLRSSVPDWTNAAKHRSRICSRIVPVSGKFPCSWMYQMVQQSQMYRLVHLRIGHREDRMKGQDKLMLFVFGVLFWVLGTLYYRLRGHVVLEVSSLRYWSNFVLVPVASAAVCILILRALHIPAREWAAAMLLIALPGMFGEAALL